MAVLRKPPDLNKPLSLWVYSWIEFCNLAAVVYMNPKNHWILEAFEDNYSDKDGSIL